MGKHSIVNDLLKQNCLTVSIPDKSAETKLQEITKQQVREVLEIEERLLELIEGMKPGECIELDGRFFWMKK